MFFANLSALEFLALFTAVSAATVALYLLIRSRRQYTVATLRFWQNARQDVQQKRRRKVDQPWSLLLQLLAIACLLLAIAQPRLGRPDTSGLDHILLLDNSAWLQNPALHADSQRLALAWLKRVPSQDRVMVVRADSLATPVTRFESNHTAVEAAIKGSVASSSALDLQPAFDLAQQAMRLEARSAGEILYVGPGQIEPSSSLNPPRNLRVLSTKAVPANLGLTRVTVRRDANDATLFNASVTSRNYSSTPYNVPLTVGLGGALVSNQLVTLAPHSDAVSNFSFRSTAAGWLEARLNARDGLPADDRALLEIPVPRRLRVAVYSSEPDLLRPMLSSDARVEPTYYQPSQYASNVDADLVILDSFSPATLPLKASLLIRPGTNDATITRWNSGQPIASGIHSKDMKLKGARVLTPGSGDVVVAETAQGPVILASAVQGQPKRVTLGFHPLHSDLRYELTTPLLFANLMQWISPETFLRQEVLAATPGSVSADLNELAAPDQIRVLDSDGAALPFTVDGRTVRFFTASPSTVRVLAPNSELMFALSLPGLGSTAWEIPSSAARGLAAPVATTPLPKEMWQILAILGALLIALEWWLYRSKPAAPLAMVLKLASIAAVLISLFQPGLPVHETKLGVAVLADTSASISGGDLALESKLVSSIDDARGRHIVRVLPFARSIRMAQPQEYASGWKLRGTGGEMGRETSLESAIREASATLPAGLIPRIVLISDGKENSGSVARAAWQARQLGIPIDTFALPGQPEPKLKLESARLPEVAFTGERFPIELNVESPSKASGTLELLAEGKPLGSTQVALEPGMNHLRVSAAVATPGAIDFLVTLKSPELGELRVEQAVSLRRPRLLYLSQDASGMESHLFGTLTAAQFDVVSNVLFADARFDDYQLVLFNNWDMEAMPASRKADLERFVQQGGGLMVIGGEHNIYVDKKNLPQDALDRTLPALIAPPRSPEGASVILIVDKSSSMEGRKMELARLAAIGVVENLRPIDQVGVLIFDNSFQWAVPLRRAEDRTLIKRLVAGITPDGGTQIAPALTESYKRMTTATGAYKHIVLLTDGISEEGDSMTVARDAANNRITISTVGLGQDVNRAYLEKVALTAKGKAYFLTDPSGLEQILLKDVMEHTGSTTIEKTIQPKVAHQAEILEGLPMDKAPALKGYVRFQAKPTAETILSITSSTAGEKDDPLLARWQYGLGRAAVFTSDAKSRWAASWVTWAGYDKFWANVLRDLLPHSQPGQSTLTNDSANGNLVVEYRLSQAVPAPDKLPALFAIGPDGFQVPVTLERLSADHFRGKIQVGNRKGLFRVRPLVESRAFPEVGLYLPEPEVTTYGNNTLLLQQLAAYTGGRFNPAAKRIFDSTGPGLPSSMRLWPGLLAAALLFNLLELAWRRLFPGLKWGGLKARLPRAA
ncbi:VWA domain-containing protein [Paludibaculum fermentans]|uniref:VWA domain-containing protein n=1 Tax=Paludibaculum fermentans TaxID=1473598 RepID=UPI003EBF5C31